MSNQCPIPAEWRTAAEETAKALSVARAIERRTFPEGDAPVSMLPALTLAAALMRIASEAGDVADAIRFHGDPGIPRCMSAIAETLEDIRKEMTMLRTQRQREECRMRGGNHHGG